MTLAFLVAAGEVSRQAAGPHEVMCSQCYGSSAGCEHCRGKARRAGNVLLKGSVAELTGPDEWEAIAAWNVARAGFLPEAGGFNDQSEWFQQIFMHLQACMGTLEADKTEGMKKKVSKQGAPPSRAPQRVPRATNRTGGFGHG